MLCDVVYTYVHTVVGVRDNYRRCDDTERVNCGGITFAEG